MKKKTTFTLLLKQSLSILLILISMQLFAGQFSTIELPVDKKDLNNSEWQLYQEQTGVQVYYKSVECHDVQNGIHQQFIVLKFVNTTDTDLNMTWNTQFWFDGVCSNCDNTNGEYLFQISLKGGESIEGNCGSEYKLKIFLRFLNYDDKAELTNFELADLTVSP